MLSHNIFEGLELAVRSLYMYRVLLFVYFLPVILQTNFIFPAIILPRLPCSHSTPRSSFIRRLNHNLLCPSDRKARRTAASIRPQKCAICQWRLIRGQTQTFSTDPRLHKSAANQSHGENKRSMYPGRVVRRPGPYNRPSSRRTLRDHLRHNRYSLDIRHIRGSPHSE